MNVSVVSCPRVDAKKIMAFCIASVFGVFGVSDLFIPLLGYSQFLRVRVVFLWRAWDEKKHGSACVRQRSRTKNFHGCTSTFDFRAT